MNRISDARPGEVLVRSRVARNDWTVHAYDPHWAARVIVTGATEVESMELVTAHNDALAAGADAPVVN